MSQALEKLNSLIKPNASIVSDRSVKLITESVDKLKNAETIQERQKILTEQILKLENERSNINKKLVLDQKKLPTLSEKILGTINRGLGFQFGSAFTKGVDFESIYEDTVLDDKAYKKAIDKLKSEFDKLVIPPVKQPKEIVEESGVEETKGNEFTPLEQLQYIHEKELEREKKNQQELLDGFEGSEITRQQIVKDNELDILEIRRDQIDEELLLVKNGTEEYAKLLNERAKVETDISKTTVEQNIKIRKLQNKEQQDINKDHQNGLKIISDIERKEFVQKSKDIVDATDDEIVQVQTERTKASGYAIKQAKGNAAKTKQIQQELTLGMIDDEYKAKQKLLLDDLYRNNLTVEDKKKITSRLVDLEKNRSEIEAQITVDNEKQKQEIRQQIFEKSAELVNAGFDIMQQGYANQLSRLEEQHKAEVLAAGESVEKRIIADIS